MTAIQPYIGQIGAPGHGAQAAYLSQVQLSNSNGTYDVIDTATVTLTSAQILALNTTPVTLVAAQGANTYVQVIALAAKLDFNSVAYTGSNAANITYTNAAGAAATGTIASSFLDSASSAAITTIPVAVAPVVNSPIVVSVGTANPAAGNSTITFDVLYRVVTLA
jgi:hypothetical protein